MDLRQGVLECKGEELATADNLTRAAVQRDTSGGMFGVIVRRKVEEIAGRGQCRGSK